MFIVFMTAVSILTPRWASLRPKARFREILLSWMRFLYMRS